MNITDASKMHPMVGGQRLELAEFSDRYWN
jgi:hypothetical protein